MQGLVHEVESDEEFDLVIETGGDKLLSVDFYATWCGPCKVISPFFNQLSATYNDVLFFRVDVDKLKATAMKYGINAMPTFGFFKNGNIVDKFVGANPSGLEQKLKLLLGPSSATSPLSSAPPKNRPPSKFFNIESYYILDTGKTDQISDKLLQFNTKLASNDATKTLSLSDSEQRFFKTMVSTISNTNKYHVTSFSNEEYQVMLKLLNWPVSERFPVLDLLRLQVLHPQAANYYGKMSLITNILKFITDSTSTFPVIMMSLRFIANSMRNEGIRKTIVPKFKEIMQAIKPHFKHDNKNVRGAAAAVLFNFAIYFTDNNENMSEKLSIVSYIIEFLPSEIDEETQHRLVLTVGVLVYKDDDAKAEILKSKNVLSSLKPASPKVNEVFSELIAILENRTPVPTTNAPKPSQPLPTPQLSGLPGMGTGMPPMGAPGNINYDLMNKIASSPDMLRLMQNPTLMAKLQEVMANPMKAAEYQNDPEFAQLMQLMFSLMQQ